MLDLDQQTPEQHRARYEALRQAARGNQARFAPASALPPLDASSVIAEETVPAGWYLAWRMRRGEALRIVNTSGTPGVALFLWNAEDTAERYNAGDTVKLQWTARLTAGRLLFSDMGRVMAAITADTAPGHDTILGPGSEGPRNGRDLLRLAAGKFGLTRRDLGPALSLFSAVATDAEGHFSWTGNPPAGAGVDLRAEMPLYVALANAPHALAPVAAATGTIAVTRYRASPVTADDACRTATEEAARGYANTDALFA
ncbi:urea amidolyase associated protein UAAP1 [Acidisoma sp. 7E03]